MKLLRGWHKVPKFEAGTVVTIGNFDGVHLGHQSLLAKLREEANRLHLPLVVLLFEPQPNEYFLQEKAPARISSLREKLTVLQKCGVDYVFCLKFDEKLAQLSDVSFAQIYLFGFLQARYVLIGHDFRFGQGRLGDVALLRELAVHHQCDVETYPDVLLEKERISSTKIRQALHINDFKQASVLLGRQFNMCGRVISGDGRGRKWGIPTANLSIHKRILPFTGVFFVRVMRKNSPLQAGVANLGCRPTVDGQKNLLEVHLLDFDSTLYGEILEIVFLHKLRDEIKFPSLDALICQIQEDINAAKEYFVEDANKIMLLCSE